MLTRVAPIGASQTVYRRKKQTSAAANKDTKRHSSRGGKRSRCIPLPVLTPWNWQPLCLRRLTLIIICVRPVIPALVKLWRLLVPRAGSMIPAQHGGGKCLRQIDSERETSYVKRETFKRRNWCLEFITKHSFLPPSLPPPSYLALLQLVAPQVTSELVCAFRIDLFVRALKKLGDAGGLLISWERSCNSKLSVVPRSNVQHLTSERKRLLTEMCFCTHFGPVDQGGEHQAAEWRYENTFIFCLSFFFPFLEKILF